MRLGLQGRCLPNCQADIFRLSGLMRFSEIARIDTGPRHKHELCNKSLLGLIHLKPPVMNVPRTPGMTDEELMIYALREAQLILAGHIDRGRATPKKPSPS
jgi:hypothetical protein